MTLYELQAELFQNLTEHLDTLGLEDYVSELCDTIEKTFDDNFYPATITGVEIVSKTNNKEGDN